MRELDWFDGREPDEATTRAPRPRRRLLTVLAAVPWLLVAAILTLPLGGDPVPDDDGLAAQVDPLTPPHDGTPGPGITDGPEVADTPAEAGLGAVDQEGPVGTDSGDADSAAPDSGATGGRGTDSNDHRATGVGATDTGRADTPVLALEELRGRWRVAPGEEELAALAVVLARAHLTGIGPGLEVEGAEPPAESYAEHLVVEAVEHPSPSTAVVTVLAVLLVDPSTGPSRVELRRLAVPLTRTEDLPATGGPPWELPPPSLPPPAAVELEPVEDPSLVAAADTALAVAGLGEQRTTALATAPGWPLVATTIDDQGEERSLWLRRHLEGLVVAGSTLAGAPSTEEAQP